MNEIEAIGGAVMGGTLAKMVEPDTGAVAEGRTHAANCLNCATPLAGDYCHACGQRGHVHRTLRAFFHDLLHGVLHFEGKTSNTLPLLAWRPGELTRRYIDGERAKFVSPIALFLFSVFLMFAILSATSTKVTVNEAKMAREFRTEIQSGEARLKQLTEERAAAARAGSPRAGLDAQIASLDEKLRLKQSLAEKGILAGSAARVSDDVPAWLREPIERAGKNPQLLLFKLKTNAYKWSWALIPLSVPFLCLLFPFSRRFRLYDHLVFVTYSLSFMTLLVCVTGLALAAGAPAVLAGAMLYVPFHMYRQLRGTYRLGRTSAILRTIALGIMAVVALSLFGFMMLAVGVLD